MENEEQGRIFKKGEVVRLKSSGPNMTVDGFSNSEKVSCIWFDDDAVLHKGDFDESTLFRPRAEQE